MPRVVLPADLGADDRARLRRRYPPPRLPRPVLVAVVALLAATGTSWLVWSGLYHARPAVSSRVSAYTVTSDRSVQATLTVDRPDPSVPVRCRVQAQAVDFQIVGEQTVEVPAGPYPLVNVDVTVTTVRRATSASAAECSRI